MSIKVIALRRKGVIQATLIGASSSCDIVTVEDIYPGGNINYVDDPGEAQVFLTIEKNETIDICIFPNVPFIRHAVINDKDHDKLTLYVNEEKTETVEIIDTASKDTSTVVIARAGIRTDSGNYVDCQLRPTGSIILGIYSIVFGPASKAECQEFMKQTCATPFEV